MITRGFDHLHRHRSRRKSSSGDGSSSSSSSSVSGTITTIGFIGGGGLGEGVVLLGMRG